MQKITIRNNFKTLLVPFFAILFLLSPCSVRAYLNTSLQLEIPKPLNQNKTTIEEIESCEISESFTHIEFKNSVVKESKILNRPISLNLALPNLPVIKWSGCASYTHLNQSNIPLYILFKRFKFYDLNSPGLV